MKFDVKKYAGLARIKLTKDEEKNISKDIDSILEYFKELEKLDTKNVKPVIGGANFKNVFREDKKSENEISADDSPSEYGGYLKVPKVFD